jgi:Na+/H+ antiporter
MHEAEIFVALLVAVILATLAVRRLERLPDAVVLVAGGIVAGLLPFAPDVNLEPDLIFVVFLPPILYPSAFTFAFEDVRSNLQPIGGLAIGLVVATMGVIAVAVHVVAGVPWAASFVLGAVLAPTDPVAATAVIRTTGAPSRLATVLEGESLINDGTALTGLKVAVAAVAGSFSLGSAAGQLALNGLGGAAVGVTLGWLTSKLRRRLDDLQLETAISVLLAYGAYLLAERLGVSGVLAVVLAGYVMGRSDEIASPDTRVGAESFWAVIQFLGESILFLLVGIAFAQLLEHPTVSLGEAAGLSVLVAAVAIAIRLGWLFLVPLVAPTAQGIGPMMSRRERGVVGVAGLRGALSVAAALSIPVAVAGTAFPDRDLVITVAIGAIVLLLVGPALILPIVVRVLGLADSEDTEAAERRARAALADAALACTDELGDGDVPEDVLERVRGRYEARLRRYAGGESQGSEEMRRDGDRRAELYRELNSRVVAAQRARLAELRRDGDVQGELLRDLERDLDVDEIRSR